MYSIIPYTKHKVFSFGKPLCFNLTELVKTDSRCWLETEFLPCTHYFRVLSTYLQTLRLCYLSGITVGGLLGSFFSSDYALSQDISLYLEVLSKIETIKRMSAEYQTRTHQEWKYIWY